jgi:hypothetical protein
MANCNDCWCEHYDKNKGNCDKCLKNETEEKIDFSVVLKNRTVKQMELDKKMEMIGHER